MINLDLYLILNLFFWQSFFHFLCNKYRLFLADDTAVYIAQIILYESNSNLQFGSSSYTLETDLTNYVNLDSWINPDMILSQETFHMDNGPKIYPG